MNVFELILEMDENDERDFSQPVVMSYFDQAEHTLMSMGQAL